MKICKLICVVLCGLSVTAFAASPLPQKMEGQRSTNGGRTNKVEVELVQMEGADKAKIKAIYYDGCTRSGETTAEFLDGAWQFTIPGSVRCDPVIVSVRPVEGKNRLEGEFKTGKWDGSIYYEW